MLVAENVYLVLCFEMVTSEFTQEIPEKLSEFKVKTKMVAHATKFCRVQQKFFACQCIFLYVATNFWLNYQKVHFVKLNFDPRLWSKILVSIVAKGLNVFSCHRDGV
jgi:fucose 4-O-acetylase-like acetyltransferase